MGLKSTVTKVAMSLELMSIELEKVFEHCQRQNFKNLEFVSGTVGGC